MAFCTKCGAEIKGTEQFCPSCGAAVSPDSSSASPDEDLQSKMSYADSIMNAADVCYQNADQTYNSAVYARNQDYAKKTTHSNFIHGMFFTIFCVLIILISSAAKNAVLFLILLAIGIFVLVCINASSNKAIKGKCDAEFARTADFCNAKVAEGQKLLADNLDRLAFIPMDYWYPMATGYMLHMIQTNRADTINQLLQMYDEQLHRWKIENAQAQMVELQRQQTDSLNGIRTSSAISAAANAANVAVNSANLAVNSANLAAHLIHWL